MTREPFPKSRRLLAELIRQAEAVPGDPQPLTQAILDREGCMTPGCTCDDTTIFLAAQCHPRAGSVVSYSKPTGTLRVRCKACQTPIAEIMVAAS